jgi:perosamine synthetase
MIFSYLKSKYGICDVYTPSLAFTSPVWAAKHFGHNIIWVDINNDLVFDCKDYLTKRNNSESNSNKERKKVVMPILYGGISTINDWNLQGDEIVIVDSAHCITPTIKSDFAFFSFHPTKPVCTSDGGMISTDLEEAFEYFKYYRNFGRQSKNNEYNIIQEGFKFYMNNLNATIGLVSLNNYDKSLEIRKKNYISLKDQFPDKLLNHDENSSYYFATLITDNAEELNNRYGLAKHYPLLHKTKYYDKDHCVLNNTEKLYAKIVNLSLTSKY